MLLGIFGLPANASIEPIHIGLILEVGVLLLALVLYRFSNLLGGLLAMIHRPPIAGWLKIAAVVLIVTFVIPHYIVVAVLYPSRTTPEVGLWLLIFRAVSFFGLLVASVLALIPCMLYYRWTNE